MNAPASFDLFTVPERIASIPMLYSWNGVGWGFHILLPARIQ
jgi:hypothetical protein